MRKFITDILAKTNLGVEQNAYVLGTVGIGTSTPGAKLHIYGAGSTELRIGSSTANTNSLLSFYEASLASWGIEAGQANGPFYIKDLYNSATRLTINASGNVGIGTASPSYKLDVNGTARVQSGLYVDENSVGAGSILRFIGGSSYYNFQIAKQYTVDGGLEITPSTAVGGSTYSTPALVVKANGNVGIGTTSPSFQLSVQGIAQARGGVYVTQSSPINTLILNADDTALHKIYTNSNVDLSLGTNGSTSQLYLKNGGNVGIGTTSPVTGLDVRTSPYSNTTARFGTSRPVYIINDDPIIGFNQYYNSGWKSGTTGYSGNIGVSSSGEMYFNVSTASVATDNTVTQREVIRILNNGNVGIGTNSPGGRLDVVPSAQNGINIARAGGYPSLYSSNDFVFETDSIFYFGVYTPRLFSVNGSFYVTTSGNVGIGTSSPVAKLQVDGALKLTSNPSVTADGSAAYFWNQVGVGPTIGGFRFQVQTAGSSVAMTINESQNVGIGTTSPSEKLFVNSGGAYMDTTVSYGTNTKGIALNQDDGTGYGMGIWFRQSGLTAGIGSTRVNSSDWATDLRFYTHPSSTTNQNTLFERMRINSEGNVGIGTTAPNAKLEVVGNTYLRGGALYVDTIAGYTSNVINLASGTNLVLPSGNIGVRVTNPTVSLSLGSSAYDNNPLTGLQYAQVTGGGRLDLMVQTWGTGSDYGLTTGLSVVTPGFDTKDVRVGIGTTSPGAKLDVIGSLKVGNSGISNGDVDLWSSSNGIHSGSSLTWRMNTGGGNPNSAIARIQPDVYNPSRAYVNALDFYVGDWNNNNNVGNALMSIMTSGNVGIGTTYPTQKLHVVGSQYTTGNITVGASGNYGNVNFVRNDGAGVGGIGWRSDGVFYVGGHLDYGPNAGNNVRVYGFGANLSLGNNASGDVLNITNAGNVGIGTSSPGYKLQVVGEIYTNYRVQINDGTANLIIGHWDGVNARIENSGGRPLLITSYSQPINMSISGSGPAFSLKADSNAYFTGSLGIGTTSPTYKLDVSGVIRSTSDIIGNRFYTPGFAVPSSANGVFNNTNYSGPAWNNASFVTGNGATGVMMGGDAALYSYGWIQGVQTDNGATKGLFLNPLGGNVNVGGATTFSSSVTATQYNISNSNQTISIANTSDIQINAAAAGSNILFRAAGDERMRITSAGNVGIGTTSPNAKLQIIGPSLTINDENTYGLWVSETGDDTKAIILGYDQGIDAGIITAVDKAVTWKNIVLQPIAGNVGIGTISPNAKLASSRDVTSNDFNNLGAVQLKLIGSTYTNKQLLLGFETDNDYGLIQTLNDGASWSSYNLAIQPKGGNVGIGTVSPQGKLDITGTNGSDLFYLDAQINTDFAFKILSGSNDALILRRQHSTQGDLSIASFTYNGNVGIGTTSPALKLDVVGGTTNQPVLRLQSTDTDGYTGAHLYSSAGTLTGHFGWANGTSTTLSDKMYFGTIVNKPVVFTTNDTEKVRIAANGNVGIGTSDTNGLISGTEKVLKISNSNIASIYLESVGNGIWANYINAARSLVWYDITADAERMRITSAGNVGIGTSSPLSKFDINGGSLGFSQYNYTPSQGIYCYNGNSEYIEFGSIRTSAGSDWTSSGFRIQEKIDSTWMGFIQFNGDGNNGGVSFGTGLSSVSRQSIPTRMTIASDGNVGIGTTNPAAKFQVTDASSSITLQNYLNGAAIFLDGVNGDFIGGDYFHILADGSSYLGVGGYAGGATPLNVSNNGNVGIGTTSPSQKLEVNGNIKLSSTAGSTSTPSYIWLGNDYSNGFTRDKLKIYLYNSSAEQYGFSIGPIGDVQYHSNVYHDFYTANSLSVRINGSGNVGIGTTSPVAALHVQSSSTKLFLSNTDFVANTTGSGMIVHTGASSGNTYSQIYAFQSGNTAYANLVIPGGNVGIGTTSPLFNLQVGANSGTLATTTIRLQNSYLDTNGYYGFNIDAVDNGVDGHDLRFLGRTSPTGTFSELVRIKNSGNVGIGTANPTTPLSVFGGGGSALGTTDIVALFKRTTSSQNSYLAIDTTSADRDSGIRFGDGGTLRWTLLNYRSSSPDGFGFYNHTANGFAMFIDNDSNVGIGTTSPASKLQVNVGTDQNVGINSTGGVARISAYDDAVANSVPLIINGSDLRFTNNVSEAVRITGGNVGIGTTSPQKKLEVLIAASDFASVGVNTLAIGEWTGIHFGYRESNSAYRKSAIIFQRTGGAAQGKIHFLNNIAADNSSATLSDSKMVISDDGNVGIGTTSPAHKLDVSGNISVTASTGTKIGFNVGDAFSAYSTSIAHYGISWGWNALPTALSGYYGLGFFSQGAERMRIAENGNVGIGTTSPGVKLEVVGAIRGGSFPNSTTNSGEAWFGRAADRTLGTMTIQLGGSSATNTFFEIVDRAWSKVMYGLSGEAPTDSIRVTSSGNVGLGTGSPTEKLHVSGNIVLGSTANGYQEAGSKYIGLSYPSLGTDGYVGFQFESVNAPAPYNGNYSQNIKFYTHHYAAATGGTPRMTIQYDGNVGIGTTSPSSTLDVSSSANATTMTITSDGANEQFRIRRYSDNNKQLIFGYHSSNFGTIQAVEQGVNYRNLILEPYGGNVGIGTTSPSYKLHVEGNVSGISIYASHDIAAFSDITVKKEVKRIENAVDKVKELNGYTYVRTDDETGTRRAGVIAQEVQKVLPEVVSQNPDGTLNVAYANMIALLIEGMKEQQATIERMQQEINELKK